MATLVPISRSEFSDKRWKRHRDYQHAAQAQTAPLVFSEFIKAALHYPIGLADDGQGQFSPLCLLGLETEQNLMVGPQGQWLGDYIPACFRSYPFRLASAEDGQKVLCFVQDSGLLSHEPEDENFFTDDGEVAPALQEILNFLNQIEASRQSTAAMCAALAKHQLLMPWPIALKTADGDKHINGLYRINEEALNQLDKDALFELHQHHALGLAYFQMLSQQHLAALSQRLQLKQQQQASNNQPVANEELPIVKDYGDICFDDLL